MLEYVTLIFLHSDMSGVYTKSGVHWDGVLHSISTIL
jgi:hypothetical protein